MDFPRNQTIWKLALIGLFHCTLNMNSALARVDSLGILEIDEKAYVLHEVEEGETLYTLANRYSSSVDIIRAANDLDSVLLSGIIIRIPIGTWWKELDSEIGRGQARKHVVVSGESLFAISKSSGASVEELRAWNSLEDVSVQAGDTLIIGWNKSVADNYGFKKQLLDTNLNASLDLGKPVEKKRMEFKENSLCSVDKGISLHAYRKEALHNEIPVGTIVRVINPENGRRVFVQIKGKSDEGLTEMVLSRSAGHQLKLVRHRSRVELLYYLEN